LALPGGSKIYELTASADFTAVYIAIDGVDGYYVLIGLGASGSNQIVISTGQNAASIFTVLFGVSSERGNARPGLQRGCGIDDYDNENITWAAGTALRGIYIVRVDNWSVCEASLPIDYVVTVNVKGKATQTFQGTFGVDADKGGLGDGVEITRFTY
jgi:hypothetical protein